MLAHIIDRKKWKSAWLILNPDPISREFCYCIDRIFWNNEYKEKGKKEHILQRDKNDEEVFWLQNELYNLKLKDLEILLCNDWLNDRIMDAVQKIICKSLGTEYQSVLYVQKDFHPVNEDHIQLMHDGKNHWFLCFCSNGRIMVCDSLRTTLNRVSIKCVKSLFKHCIDTTGKPVVTFLNVQKQIDAYNCGPFAIAFAAEVIDGKSPVKANFDVPKMREHLMYCLEKQCLTPFPKIQEPPSK